MSNHEHKISEDPSFKSDTLSSQSLSSIIENDTETSSLNDIQKQFARISPSFYSKSLSSITDSNQFSSIPYIDSSSLLDDQELSERKQSLTDLNRQISITETDLVASLHRDLNKQNIDNLSNDDILFLEWDKERNLFQDYINSLRKEIRVLLQERLEYQQKISHESKYINDDQMKIDLLQKSLEEKNFVLEQLQSEYEIIKEKNTNLIRTISSAQCDTKSYISINDDLKQKIADLTIDLQNHVLVKQRLEISINNLEKDCKIIDAERIRLTNDIKENQHNKQDLEKLLQKANVQIAEQGSTIEMLRSENVQVRSQLSTMQRRMFQEKQQIMDYLRQIENDLIEKEQIKQRESLLREDYEQLKKSINHDQRKIGELQHECSQLLKTIQTQNEETDQFKSGIKHLYSHFHIPIESHDRFYLSFEPIENHFNNLQNKINELQTITKYENIQKTDNEDELRQNLAILTSQCSQLDEANRAWQQFHQTELDNFRNKLRDYLDLDENISFDQIAQLIVNQIIKEREESEKANNDLRSQSEINLKTIDELSQELLTLKEQDQETSESSSTDSAEVEKPTSDDDEKIKQDYILLQNQCAQLDYANQSWQQFYENQIDFIRNQFKDYLDFDKNFDFNQIIQIIASEFRELGTANNDIDLPKKSSFNSEQILNLQEEIKFLENQIKDHHSSMDLLENNLQLTTYENEQLKQQYHQIQDKYDLLIRDNHNLTNQLHNIRLPSIEESPIHTITPTQSSNNDEIHQLQTKLSLLTTQNTQLDEANHAWQQFHQNQVELFREKFQNWISVDTNSTLEQIAQQIVNRLDSLKNQSNESILAHNLENVNQKLLDVYQQCEEFREHNTQLILLKQQLENQIKEFQLSKDNSQQSSKFIDPDQLRNTLQDYVSSGGNVSFDQIIKEREEFNQRCQALERANNDLRIESENNIESIRESCVNSIKELNLELFDVKTQCQELERINKQLLSENESLSDRSIVVDHQSPINSEFSQQTRSQSTVNKYTQYKPLKQNHIAIETNPLIYQNNQTQIDPIHMIDQQSQTELLWPISDNENLLNTNEDNERLTEYINEISVRSLTDLANQLKKECEQILSKLNFNLTTFPNLELNQLALITLHSLSNQHLIDEAKQLYNETVIRALKQEYELINDEKDDLIQKFDLERSHFEELIKDLNKKLIDKQNISPEIEQIQINDQPQVNNNALQAITNKINQAVSERPELFPDANDDTIERLDQIISAIKHQATQIDLLKNELASSVYEAIEKRNEVHDDVPKDNEEIHNLKSQLAERDEQIEELNKKYLEISSNIEILIQERDKLRDQSDELTTSSIRINQTIDNETQTDDQQQDKYIQINNKLKRALQTIKEKVNRLVTERPELFPKSTDDTIERLDQLIYAVENQAKQIEITQNGRDHVQQKLDEQVEHSKTVDDHTSTISRLEGLVQERNALVEQQSLQLTELQNQIEQLREEISQLQQADVPSDEDIQSLKNTIQQQSEELKDLSQKYLSQTESQEELNRQKREIEEQLNEHKNQIDNLIVERTNLLQDIDKKTLPSIQTTDNECQTDDRQHEKLVQLNNKLKRVLQAFKDKIQRVATERPELFEGIGEETSERLDHLISTVAYKATQVNVLQAEPHQVEQQLGNGINESQSSFETSQNEREVKMEQLSTPPTEDYQKQIQELQQNLSQKDNERTSLSERLNQVELELKKAIDDHASVTAKNEILTEERNALGVSQHEIEQLKEELARLKQLPDYQHVEIQTEEDIKALNEMIEQQSQQLNDLNEKNTTLESQTELNREKKEIEEQLNEHKSKIESLNQEREKLLEELEKRTVPVVHTTENESQTDDHEHEKLVQMNNKLKRALQSFREKISRVVTERPDLFDGVGEETSERFDHLISTVENQATQVSKLQTERDQANEEYQGQIKNLQSSLAACQHELDNERQIKTEQPDSVALLSSPLTDDTSSSIVEDYEKQIKQLQQTLSQKDDELALLRERVNEVELQLRKSLDDDALAMVRYESVVDERDRLVEQQRLQSTESQHEIEQLKEELAILKQLPVTHDVDIQTNEDIKSLHDVIEQQSQQLKDLNENNATLSTQLESQVELNKQKKQTEERLKDYENQIKTLIQQRTNLLEDIEKKNSLPIQTSHNECQTDDDQHEELVQMNNDVNSALQTFKDKIQRIVTEKPELFEGIGEETNECVDQLISTVENQATQINGLQVEHNQLEEQLRNEIKQLQSSLETSQNEVENKHREEVEQLSLQSETYQKAIQDLQQNISQKDNERISLNERLNEVELELKKTRDEHALKLAKDEEDLQSLINERNALLEQQAVYSDESQRQTEQLKTLNDKCLDLSSQIDCYTELQAEVDRQKDEFEEQRRDYKNQLDNLMQERGHLLEQIENKTSIPIQTIDNEAQTDDDRHEQLVQVNNDLNSSLQTFGDKIQRIVTERPELFDGVSEELDERVNHLISTVENQTIQVNVLQVERNQLEEQLRNEIKQLQSSFETTRNEAENKHREEVKQLSSQSETYQKEIQELQQNLSQKDNERTSLSERLNEVELELKKATNDHASVNAENETLIEERNALGVSQREIEQLKEEVINLKQLPDYQHEEIQTDEDMKALNETIEQQSQQLNDLNEKNTTLESQLQSQAELSREKKETEEQLNEHKSEIQSLKEERTKLLEELEKNTLSTTQTTENESQTNDHEHEKLVQVNNDLKSTLQTFKDKIDRAVTDKPDLFHGIQEQEDVRLDYLISTLGNQTTQIDVLHTERNHIEEQLQNEIKQLQSSLETSRDELDNERREKAEQLSSQSDNYQKQIEQLQQNLSEKDNEQTSLSKRLNEVELEFKKAIDDHASLNTKYESLIEEQKALQLAESQREIKQLKEEITKLKQLPDYQHVEIQTDEDMKSWNKMIEQLKDLDEKNTTLSSQLESQTELNKQKEMEERLNERESQIENLNQERAKLLEDNKSLKSSIETIENKLHQVKTAKPDLFGNVSEKTNEQLDHLISSIENQTKQIVELQIERDQIKEKSQHELKDLQNSFDIYRNQTDEYISHLTPITHDNETQTIDLSTLDRENTQTTESDDTDSAAWFDASPDVTEKEGIEYQPFRDIDIQCESEKPSFVELSTQTELSREKEEIEEQLNEHKSEIESLKEEHAKVLEEFEKKGLPTIETTESEKQTEDDEHEKLVKVNHDLNSTLQTFKDKIDRLVTDKPDLFDGIGEQKDVRLDHLISTVENQAAQINLLHSERNQIEEQLQNKIRQLQSSLETSQNEAENKHQEEVKQLSSRSETYQKQIQELQQNLSQKDNERTSLSERLTEVELELKKAIDDHASVNAKNETLIEERNALGEQQALQLAESQREIERLKEEVTKLKQLPDYQHEEIQTEEDMKALNEMIEQQSQQLNDLNEKNTTLESQLQSQAELSKEKKEIAEQLNEHKSEIQSLKEEHAKLLEEFEKKSLPAIQTMESENQTEDDEHEKLVQVNKDLKSTLQTLKDKIGRVVTEKPDLFGGIGEQEDVRLDHLISTVENQATQINVLHTERNQMEEQLQNEIKQLHSSLETNQNEAENKHREEVEQLSSQSETYQKEIQELQQNLSEKDNQRTSLSERLNQVELELKKATDDHASLNAKNETLIEERNALGEQQALQSAESQREIEQLKEEVTKLKKLPDYQHEEIQTEEDMKALNETIEQQSQQLNDLNEKNTILESQLESQADLNREKKEIEEQLNEHKREIERLNQERPKLLDELEKLVQVNNELNCALKAFKDKIDRVVTDRPNLFDRIGEKEEVRLDHLISTLENQASQINVLHAERDEVEKQLQSEIKELQSSLEACRYQIENECPTKTEQLVSASPPENISSSVMEDYQKEIEQLKQNLSQKDQERTSVSERLNQVELELKKAIDDHASVKTKYESLIEEQNALVEQKALQSAESQREIEQMKEEVTKLKQLPDYQHEAIQTDEDMKSWNKMIEQLKDLNEKNTTLSSQLESQTELNKQKREMEERLNERESQIESFNQERAKLLEDNKSLKSSIETIENQTKQIIELQIERDQTKEQSQHELKDLQNSFDIYRNQADEYISHLTPITHDNETQTIDLPTLDRENTQTTESDDTDSATWFDVSPDFTEKEGIEYKPSQDIDIQCELEKPSFVELSTQTEIDSFFFIENETLRTKITEILLDYPTLSSDSNKNPFDDLDQIICLIKNLQNEINSLRSLLNISSNKIENDRLINMQNLNSNHVYTQTLGLSIFEEHEKQIAGYQREIERLIEERNQARDLLSKEINNVESTSEHSLSSSLTDSECKIKQLTSQPLKIDVEIQTNNDLDLSSSSDQSISRHMFEQEMLAWSKESEQLKSFVKQIQIENNKLKDIIFQFEQKVHEYLHENERLKHENQHLSLIKYSSIQKDNFTTSDDDICYLTLKCLTYEVSQRTSNNNEQLSILTNHSEQHSDDSERRIKTIRVQNERLKSQLESYTIHFKHVQHEMSLKLREMSILKDDIERLRMNDIQSRVENHRLKCDLDDDRVKIQQLEYELTNLKFKQLGTNTNSVNNLRELLELKERELNALKEKLEYTKKTHQTELQEAQKANQFSLDNVKRFEKLDLCHEEKRRELETRLGKFCTITRPLINNQQLFIKNPIINIDELRRLIAETDTQEKVTNSLSPVRDCLSLLEGQLKDLHHSIIENHARRSKRWKYKLGFECLACESRWEVVHDVRDLQVACLDPKRFLETSLVQPMAGCSCPIMIDFVESDIRLCLDDILNEVTIRTTVK